MQATSRRRRAQITLVTSLVLGLAAPLVAQEDDPAPRFAEPVRLMAGAVPAGGTMLYPSPSVIDLNGDGTKDLVLGDLRGVVTYALATRTEEGIRLAKEERLKTLDGKSIDFNNW